MGYNFPYKVRYQSYAASKNELEIFSYFSILLKSLCMIDIIASLNIWYNL